MTIEILVLRPDGTQQVERREVPDDFYDQKERIPAAEAVRS